MTSEPVKQQQSLDELLETARLQRQARLQQQREQEVEAEHKQQAAIAADKQAALAVIAGALPDALIPFLNYPDDWPLGGAQRFFRLVVPGCEAISVSVAMQYDKGNITRPLGYKLGPFSLALLSVQFDSTKHYYVNEDWSNNRAFKSSNIIEALGAAREQAAQREAMNQEAARLTAEWEHKTAQQKSEAEFVKEPSLAEQLETLIYQIAQNAAVDSLRGMTDG